MFKLLFLHIPLTRLEIFEAAAILVVLILAFAWPPMDCVWVRIVKRILGAIARRRKLSVFLTGLLSFLGSAGVSQWVYSPHPKVHDEFSYLLAADTFAAGRLTNPPHPMGVHFESMHVIQFPTYASKYPPAQGLVLALGQALGGHPKVGLWLSSALACAAIGWMLQGWFPPGWALLGGVMTVIQIGVFGYWSQTYWGGMVAALGGALVFGAWRRLMRTPRVQYALIMGLGLAILANSRPYEGMLVSLPVMIIWLVAWLRQDRRAMGVSMRQVAIPIIGCLALTGLTMGFYNYRVTGHVLRTPYQIHESTYGMAPLFLFSHARPAPLYRHETIRRFQEDVLINFQMKRTWRGFWWESVQRIKNLWKFYLGPVLGLPLILLPFLAKYRWIRGMQGINLAGILTLVFATKQETSEGIVLAGWSVVFVAQATIWTTMLRPRWARYAGILCGLMVIGILLETWEWPHYVAPITSLVFVLLLQAMRQLRRWEWRGRATGPFIVSALPVILIALLGMRMWVKPLIDIVGVDMEVTNARDWSLDRERLLSQLEKSGDNHLVIVRYGPEHVGHIEWVYNQANIDKAKVVWAREMDPAQNLALIQYFKERKIWLLEADEAPVKLTAYSGPTAP